MYPGNLPGQVGEWENTRCHHCRANGGGAVRIFHPGLPYRPRRRLPGLRHTHSGPVGKSVRRTDCVVTVPSRTTVAGALTAQIVQLQKLRPKRKLLP